MPKLFDLHCDTALWLYRDGKDLRKNNCAVDLEKYSVFDKKAQVFAIWSHKELTDDECYVNFRRCCDSFKSQVEANNDSVCLCTDADTLKTGLDEGKLCAILAVEDARLLNGDLDRLSVLYESGVRILTLGWQGETKICGGFDTETGLTDFGFEVLKECERLGITVDVSHLSERSFWDVAGKATRPFIASHSNSSSVYAHPRSLTDMQYRTIASFGGVAGINLVGAHLHDSLTKAGCESSQVYETVCSHIEHFLEISDKSLCLGLDMDGTDPLPGLEDVSCVPSLFDALYNRGMDMAKIRQVGFGNAVEFFEKNLPKQTDN